MAGALLALPSTSRAIGPPPANDGFAAAAVIGGLPFSQTVDNSLAAIEPGEPNGCTSTAPAHTVWYRYQPAADGTLTLDTRGTDFRTTSIAVYTGAAVDQLTLVKCRLTASDPAGRLTVPVTAGTVYAVQVGSQSAASYGRMTLNAYVGGGLTGTVVDGAGRPVRACVSVLDADDRAFATGSTSSNGVYSYGDLPPGSYRIRVRDCWGYPTFVDDVADVPVEVEAGAVREVGPISVLLVGAIVGRVTTTDGAPASGLCVNVWNEEEGYTRWTTTNADGAYTFYLAAGTYSVDINCSAYNPRFSRQFHDAVVVGGPGTTAVVDAVVEHYGPPANDAFAAASVKNGDFEDTVGLNVATIEPGEPRECGSFYSVWYRWTPDFTDTVELDVTGYATAVGLYRGDAVDHLEQVACQDTAVLDPLPEAAVLAPVEAGQTYYVRLATSSGGTSVASVRVTRLRGGGELTVDEATTPCAAACPYWTYGGDPQQSNHEAACQPDPLAPPGSWQDHGLTVPAEVDGRAPDFLVVQFDPEFDYDGFVCRRNADEHGAYAVGSTADTIVSECTQRGDRGCPEEGVFRVAPGDELVIRVYNWSANGPQAVQYRYAG